MIHHALRRSVLFWTAALLLGSTLRAANTPGPDIHVEIADAVQRGTESVVDVVIGNRGDRRTLSNFDAFLEVARGTDRVCSKATNFLTPLDAGQRVRTFRFRFSRPADRGAGSAELTLRVHTHFWDDRAGNDIDPRNNQETVVLRVPAEGAAECIVLKPIQ